MDEFDKLSVYMDYYITQRANEHIFRHLNENGQIKDIRITFEMFCNDKTYQTGKTWINEWIWKFPDRFK